MFDLGRYLTNDGDMVGDLARGLRIFPGLREARALGAAKWVRGETSFCLGNVVMSEGVFVAMMRSLGAELSVCPQGQMSGRSRGRRFYGAVDLEGALRHFPFVNVYLSGSKPTVISPEVRQSWQPVEKDASKEFRLLSNSCRIEW